MSQSTPNYTFVSVSTAKPGRLDDLSRISSAPTQRMDGKVPGLLAYQVSVDRERNTAVVWATFDSKATLYDFLATAEGKDDHGESEPMSEIIESFSMYDLTPISGRMLESTTV